jgi:hypothetical protein
VSTVQDAGWAPQAVAENVAPHRNLNLCPQDGAVFFLNCGKINAVNELAGFIWLRTGINGGLFLINVMKKTLNLWLAKEKALSM